jgi:hypothetical protein
MPEDTLMRQKLANRGGTGEYATDAYVTDTTPTFPGDGTTPVADALGTFFDTTVPAAGGLVHIAPGVHLIDDDLTLEAAGDVAKAIAFAPGAVLSVAEGKTLTINAPIHAGLHQIFTGEGTVVFGSRAAPERIYPEWWGARTEDAIDDHPAVLAAAKAAHSAGGGRVWLRSGTYLLDMYTSDALFVGLHNVEFTGAPGAVIQCPQVALPEFKPLPTFQNCTNIRVRGLKFDCNGNPAFGGLRFWNCSRVWIEDNHFYDSDPQPLNGFDRVALQFYSASMATPSPWCQDIVIRNNLFEDLQVETYVSKNVWFTGNTVRRSVATGGFVAMVRNYAGQTVENVFVTDNQFENCQGACVYLGLELDGQSDCTFRNIVISRNVMVFGSGLCRRGVYFGVVDTSWTVPGMKYDQVQITDNHFFVKASSAQLPGFLNGIMGNNSSTANIAFERIEVRGNVFLGNGTGTAIDLRRISHSKVHDNHAFGFLNGISLTLLGGNVVEGNEATAGAAVPPAAAGTAFAFNLGASTGTNSAKHNRVLGATGTRYSVSGNPAATDSIEQEPVTFPTTLAAGDIPYASGSANALSALALVANRVLTSVGGVLQWSAGLLHSMLPTGAGTWNWGAANLLQMTGQTRFNGIVGVGVSPSAETAFRVFTTLTGGGASQNGIVCDPTFAGDATTSGYAIAARPKTAAATFTQALSVGVAVQDASRGAGSTITTQVGVDVASLSAGATNIGIRTGTSQNRFAGPTVVGSNSTAPDAAAALQVESTTQGLLLPRMTTVQRDAIASPPNGLVIYNTTTGTVQARAAGAWVSL